MLARDSGVLHRFAIERCRTSPGLEPHSSQEMKPASMGEPEMDAVQLEGRGVLSILQPRLAGLTAEGGE